MNKKEAQPIFALRLEQLKALKTDSLEAACNKDEQVDNTPHLCNLNI
jgi:hypothetical protein